MSFTPIKGTLKRERQAIGETAKVIYQWGPRARCEVDRKAMLTMVAEVTLLCVRVKC